MNAASVVDFIVGIIRDPNSKDMSSARVCAVLFALTAIIMALYITIILRRMPTHEESEVLGVFVVGGCGGLLLRKKADGAGGDT